MLHDPRHAEQGRPDIEGRTGIVLADQGVGAGDAGEQGDELRLDGDDDAAFVAFLDLLGIADEVDRVAHALLGFEEQGAAVERGAVPDGVWVRDADERLAFQTPVVFRRAFGIVAQQQERDAEIFAGFDVLGFAFEGLAEAGDGVWQAAGPEAEDGLAVDRFPILGIDREGGVKRPFRLGHAAEIEQDDAHVAIRAGVVGAKAEGLVVGMQGLLLAAHHGERVAEIVPGDCETGIELDGAAIGGFGLFVAAQVVADDSEVAPGTGVERLLGEDLAIGRFRSGVIAALMNGPARRKGFGRRRHVFRLRVLLGCI